MWKKLEKQTKIVIVLVVVALLAIAGIGIYHSFHPPVTTAIHEAKTKKKTSKKDVVVEKKNEEETTPSSSSTTTSPTKQDETPSNPPSNKTTENSPTTSSSQKDTKTKKSTTPSQEKTQSTPTPQTNNNNQNQTKQTTQNQSVQEAPVEEKIHLTITGINQNYYDHDMTMKEGATAYSILTDTGLPYTKTGFGSATYVRSINGLYEKDHGPLSGWMYKVNGVAPNVSAASYHLKKGDQVVWYYVNYN